MKKILLFAMALALTALLPAQPSAQAADEVASWDVHLVVNGQAYQTSAKEGAPYINSQGRTMVPVRVIGQALGFTVDFKDGKVILENKTLPLQATFYPGKNIFDANNKQQTMDSKMVISPEGRAYFPLRTLAGIHAEVQWDAKTRTVYIKGNFSQGKHFMTPVTDKKYNLVTDDKTGSQIIKMEAANGSAPTYYSFTAQEARQFLTDKSSVNPSTVFRYGDTDYIGISRGFMMEFDIYYFQVPKDRSKPLKFVGLARRTSDIMISDNYFYATDGDIHSAPDIVADKLYKTPIGTFGKGGEVIKTPVAVNESRFFINDKGELWALSPEGHESKLLDQA